jgi:acyl carrier protein
MRTNDITDEEFIEVINKLSEYESNDGNFIAITSLDQSILETNLDSLGVMMLFMWLDTTFGVSEEDGKKFMEENDKITGQTIVDFIKKYQTKCYTKEELDTAIRSVLS